MWRDYSSFFREASGAARPREWQAVFASEPTCRNRLVPVGTGLGKTLGLMLAWFYHRIVRDDLAWPRRLVWCLPMRVLVEQTISEFKDVCSRLCGPMPGGALPRVFPFMGGIDADAALGDDQNQWHLHPERCAIFVGTPEMLLSRVLGRGYAAARGRWPIDFALLHSDCLWIFDEVQLMGVGAVTGAQLQAFRDGANSNGRMLRPSYTWWASATLRKRWLETVDSRETIERASGKTIVVPDGDKSLPVFAAKKPLQVVTCHGKIKSAAVEIANLAIDLHGPADQSGHVTVVVLNRVADAIEVFTRIQKTLGKESATDVRLIHSRFRGRERERWRQGDGDEEIGFLSRKACENENTDRIIVATQVIEAGVDISAGSTEKEAASGGLVTELAPISSLVQRFGRAARYGGTATVVVVDRGLTKKDALPYEEDALAASLEALNELDDVGLITLEAAEEQWKLNSELDERLFKLDYQHLLREHEFNELFDTSPDLTGDDIDISRFIREGDENNAYVCWIVPGEDSEEKLWQPPSDFAPGHADICPVPFIVARNWLLDPRKVGGFRKIRPRYAYAWDYHDGKWKSLRSAGDIIPGATVLVDSRIGGYDATRGFVGKDGKSPVPEPFDFNAPRKLNAAPDRLSDSVESRDALSVTEQYQSIADHGKEVGDEARAIAKKLELDDELTAILAIAGHWHDWGKSHAVFQANVFDRHNDWKESDEIAKAPDASWRKYWQAEFNCPEASLPSRFERSPHGKRRGFRHELASALGLLELVRRVDPQHPALLGGDLDLADQMECPLSAPLADPAVAQSLVALSERSFNLLLYLIAAHHGKVRCGLHMTEADQDYKPPRLKTPGGVSAIGAGAATLADVAKALTQPIRGVCTGDQLPAVHIYCDEKMQRIPTVTLNTDVALMGWGSQYGPSWSQRVLHLIEELGPFDLALLEAILRAADVLKSRAA